MKIKLKLRAVSAYFSPNKLILADNEDLEIKIQDKGLFKEKTVLSFNGKTFFAQEGIVTISRKDLCDVNVFELTERDENDLIKKKVSVENLYVLPCKNDEECGRLIAEREFYQKTLTDLLCKVERLTEINAQQEKRLAALENGKFTMLKFGGKEK